MDKSKKLCVLCPSRERPKLLKRMLDSYHKNSVQSDIYFAFELNDTDLHENVKVIGNKYKNKYWLLSDIGFARKVNILCDEYPGYAAYMILNDDQVIQTKGWDKILLNRLNKLKKESGHGLHILHWRDGINDNKLCQSFVTKEMKELLGSYYPRRYMKHLYTDNMYYFIGTQCGLLNYVPEVYIEHLHVCKDRTLIDNNYLKTQNKQAYERDSQLYVKWLREKCINVCNKILLVVMEDKKKIPLKLKRIKKKIEALINPKK